MEGIGNCEWHSSEIEDEIYNLLNSNLDFIAGIETYTAEAIDAVSAHLLKVSQERHGIQWNVIENPHPNMEGASASICWIENGFLNHIVLDVKY